MSFNRNAILLIALSHVIKYIILIDQNYLFNYIAQSNYMEYDCHIFSKCLVFQMKNLVFQLKYLVFRWKYLVIEIFSISIKNLGFRSKH